MSRWSRKHFHHGVHWGRPKSKFTNPRKPKIFHEYFFSNIYCQYNIFLILIWRLLYMFFCSIQKTFFSEHFTLLNNTYNLSTVWFLQAWLKAFFILNQTRLNLPFSHDVELWFVAISGLPMLERERDREPRLWSFVMSGGDKTWGCSSDDKLDWICGIRGFTHFTQNSQCAKSWIVLLFG